MTVTRLQKSCNNILAYGVVAVLILSPFNSVFADEVAGGANAGTSSTSSVDTSSNTSTVTSAPIVAPTPLVTVLVPTTTVENETTTTPMTVPANQDNGTHSTSDSAMNENTSATTSASTTLYEMNATTTVGTTTEVQAQGNNGSNTALVGSSTIVSGTSVAMANVLNLVNTNFVNSNGVIVFKNFFDTLLDNFDLRGMYSALTGGCSFTSCTDASVQTSITNGATLENDLSVRANSGGNTIATSSQGSITTGNAYAGVNLINVANTNVIDSNYLLVTMNAFKNVDGDIVFPSLSNFFGTLGNGSSPAALTVNNTAGVENNVLLTSDAGHNSTANTLHSTITTGESSASSNVFNQINTSLVGNQSISILFRVHGTWAGQVFGAPANLGWVDDGKGGIYLFDKVGTANGRGNTSVTATNTVAIHNNVSVVALTGDNAITGADTALISTGNAYAGANIVNVANATVVGRNWILAVINIFGDFKGNIAFGRPDLWVSGKVAVPPSIHNDSDLKYTLTVINNGDSPASNVILTDTTDVTHLAIHDASVPYSRNENGALVWQLPDLLPGKATEISYYGRVQSAQNNTDITNKISVTAHETDNNTSDNSDTITVTTDAGNHASSIGHIRISSAKISSPSTIIASTTRGSEKDISLTRLPTSLVIEGEKGGKVTQNLILKNTTDKSIPGVIVHDFLRDPSGTLIHDEPWELGTLQPKEEIHISYDSTFAPTVHTGLYTFNTEIVSANGIHALYAANGSVLISAGEPVLGRQKSALSLLTAVHETLKTSSTSVPIMRMENATDSTSTATSTIVTAGTQIGNQQAAVASVPGMTFRYSLYALLMALLSLAGIRYFVRTPVVAAHISSV